MLVMKCTEYHTLNIYHTGEITSTNNVEHNYQAHQLWMKCRKLLPWTTKWMMKESCVQTPCWSHLHNLLLNSAVADVRDGSRNIRWGRKKIKTQFVSPSTEQRTNVIVWSTVRLRPPEPGSRDILLVQKLSLELFPPVVWKLITKTQLLPQQLHNENVICGVQCWLHPITTGSHAGVYWRQGASSGQREFS